MGEIGKWLFFAGLGAALVGGLLWWGGGHWKWLGHLPGDIHIQREGFSFHFPLATCLLLSIVVSLLWRWLAK